jgi:3-hydroxyisobutyrate dehydrogenase-like beta-hydroxyacid dehydrogenase
MIKDLRLASEAAAAMGIALPGVALVLEHLRRVEAAGGGAQGTQALLTALE